MYRELVISNHDIDYVSNSKSSNDAKSYLDIISYPWAMKELRYLIKWPRHTKTRVFLNTSSLRCFTLMFLLNFYERRKDGFDKHNIISILKYEFWVSSNCFTLIFWIIKYRARRIIIRFYCLVTLVANSISENELIDKVNHDYVNWCTYLELNEQNPRFICSNSFYHW